MKLMPAWLKTTLKRSRTIVALTRGASWKLHLLKDWWGTKVWRRTSVVMTPLGFKLVSGFHPAYKLMREGRFEIEETSVINAVLDRVDVFVDVGANLGYYTCLASQHGKHVVAFEPQSQNLRCLMQNLVVNSYQDQVEVLPLALSERPGLLTLYGASGPSASLIKGWAGYSSIYSQRVPVSTLDIILGQRFENDQIFIKIDVEGAEYQVLKGAQAIINRTRRPIWLLEICLQEFHPLGANPDFVDIFDMFWNAGYEAYTATNPPRRVTRTDVSKWQDDGISEYQTFNYVFLDPTIQLPGCLH
jgi:FkbM family methyltransferase